MNLAETKVTMIRNGNISNESYDDQEWEYQYEASQQECAPEQQWQMLYHVGFKKNPFLENAKNL